VLEVTKRTARLQQTKNFRIESPFSLVRQVMNRKARNHRIKGTKRWQRKIHIVFQNANSGIGGKTLPRGLEHGRRKVDCYSFRLRMPLPHQCEQPSIACTQVENPARAGRDELQQRCLAFIAMGNLIRAPKIVLYMLARSPQIHRATSAHEKSIRKQLHSIAMIPSEVPCSMLFRSILLVVLALVSAGETPGQTPAPQNEPARNSQQQQPTKPIPPPEEPKQEEPRGDVKITPRQAEELFHSVDEILSFDSKETGLPVKHEVKRKLTSRDEVVSYLTKHLNDEDAQRLRRSELVLKKFGLLPRDFNLETFLVALLREEVAGYYDPKTKTVNLLDWVPMEEQEPVMAHELTHALQDQGINLQKWMKRGEKDLAEIKRDPTPADIENDEIDNAREAVLEGQAQAMMFQYAIAPTGHSIATSPELVGAMEEESLTGTPSTKVFNDAPIFLKESLTFPYSYGLDFVLKVLQKNGKKQAFSGVLSNPPHTTRQIMQPETYMSGEKIDPMPLPDFKRDFKDYQKFDIGAMGEFDVAVLVEQYAGKRISKQMYPEWRGGYYYAAKAKADSAAPLSLLYVSRWSSPVTAAQFAGIYAHSLNQRYKKVVESPDAQEPVQPARDQDSAPSPLQGRHSWSTEEGAVVIEQKGDTVFITESLDDNATTTLEKQLLNLAAK